MTPEEDVIHPSLLTKFRKLRLKDMNLLDMLIQKTVAIALEKGIIKTKSIIVDATHTKVRYNQKSPRELLQDCSKKLRRTIYQIEETIKEEFPSKNTEDILEKGMEYCNELIAVIKRHEEIAGYPKVQEKINLLEEILSDNLEHLASMKDVDAKVGHKTADSSFFGYKTHITMSLERIITVATVTTGEKNDGKELEARYSKSKEAGVEIDTIIGDSAYSEKGNIKLAVENDINLVARLNPSVTQGFRKKEAGVNQADCYYFDIEKCKSCPSREGCYKEGAKTKTYSVTIKSDVHKAQMEFEKSEYFKEQSKERYRIEAKNSELKHRHGYDVASSSGFVGMKMQGALAIFAVNLKRIIKLMSEK